ncbi:MAG: stage II sporulation protein M [Anaerolineae bacterium]|nr:stage II sporulation protein M [Anaerolineae bacterium]
MIAAFRPAWVIMRREIRDQLRDWRVIFPVLGLTVFFPFLMNFTAQQILDFVREYGASIIGERMVPFLLMIVGFFPISVSLVIALETFVGEKERGSIEPLLNSPLEDWQLYLGKLLAATLPPLLSSYIGMGVYLLGLAYDGVPLPPWDLLVLIFFLTMVQALMMVAGAVVVSSQATSVRSANLLASFIVIPSALLIQGESVVMFWGSYDTLWWLVFGLIVLTVLLTRVGVAHFQREELLGREIDVLNVRWAFKLFAVSFKRDARNIKEWYGVIFKQDLYRLRFPILAMLALALISVWVGAEQVARFAIPIEETTVSHFAGRLQEMINNWRVGDPLPVLAILLQNTRTMLVAMLLGFLSLGILSVLPLGLTMAVVGYLMELLRTNGLSPWVYLMFILPHGIIEIPAMVLGTASLLRAGALMATPGLQKTTGEVWIETVADWCRIMLGLVLPLLLLAAFIETWITPRIAIFFVQ